MLSMQSVQPQFGILGGPRYSSEVIKKLENNVMEASALFDEKQEQTVATLLPWVQKLTVQLALKKGTFIEQEAVIKNLLETPKELPAGLQKHLIDLTA